MNNISVVIHTRNEEKNIKECIESARLLTDNVIVVDMESTDKTKSIAKEMNTPIYSFPYSTYVEPARKFGIDKAETDWVFILDADERMTQELATEVENKIRNYELEITNNENKSSLKALKNFNIKTYYKIPRKNIFGRQKWLKNGGWWPDYQIRFINKKFLKNWPTRIHSTPNMEGEMGFLKNPFLHYFHGDIEEMVNKTIIYEEIESQLLYEAKRPVSTLIFFRKFFGELFRRLILKKGFLDGKYGIIESLYQAFSKTTTYLFLFEKYKNEKENSTL